MNHNINPEIYDKISEHGVPNILVDQCVLYLLSIYFELLPPIMDADLIRQVNIMKIVERDYTNKTTPKWIIPLFISSEQQTDDVWLWIEKEYRALFIYARRDAGGDKKACVTKMKKFFASYPEVRKDDILLAAKRYIATFGGNQTEIKYLQRADYFISKSSSGTIESRLSQYLELIKLDKAESQGSNVRHIVIT